MKNFTNFNRLSVFFLILFTLLSVNEAFSQCDEEVALEDIALSPTIAKFTWTAVYPENGVNYQWEIRTDNAPGSDTDEANGYVLSGNTPNGTNSLIITGLKYSTQYYFYIRYICDNTTNPIIASPWQITGSNSFSTLPLIKPVATPAILLSSTYFTAKWNPVLGASSYQLDVSSNSGFTTILASYNNLSVSTIYKKVTGLTPLTQYWYRVRAVGRGTDVTANSNVIVVKTLETDLNTSIWNGTSWINGIPTELKDAIIDGDYDTAIDDTFECKTLLVNSGKKLTIQSVGTGSTDGRYVKVFGVIVNEAGVDNFIVESNGNLIQVGGNLENVGDITVKRNSNPLWRLDYTMWSSPVHGTQSLSEFSPQTSSSRFFSYDTFSNTFLKIPGSTIPTPGSGYLIRMPNNWVSNPAHPLDAKTPTGPAAMWSGVFKGTPNASTLAVPLSASGDGYNLIGNPYPSALSANAFIGGNEGDGSITGTVYYWRRTNNDDPATQSNNAYYATFTIAGGTATAGGVASVDAPTIVPNNLIAKGQGFIVQVKDANTEAVARFNNTMRVTTYPAQFLRKANKSVEEDVTEDDGLERNRLWLNITNAEGGFGQTLVAYMTGASNSLDKTDGKYFNDGALSLTSYLEEKEYIIQGRALPFKDSDIVPLQFKTPKAGDYTITLAQMDGLFADGQVVYIKDNVTKTVNSLNDKPYNFSTVAGVFPGRFEVVYNTSSLSTKNPTLDANAVVVYKSNQALNINSGAVAMKSIELYDMSGRVIYKKNNVDATKLSISNLNFQDQIIIIKINTEAGIVNKKFSFTR